jgi:hypothetical protein
MATIDKQGFMYVTTFFEGGIVRSIVKSTTEEQAETLAENYVQGAGPASLLQEHVVNG